MDKKPEDTGYAIYEPRTTLADVRAARPVRIYFAMNTCWWAFRSDHLYKMASCGLPCDPRGSGLMMTSDGEAEQFLEKSESNPAHYGRHGIRAFEAALHGNVTTAGIPSSFRTWEAYNQLIDKYDAQKKIEATIGKEMNAKVEKMAAEIRRLESLRDSKRNNEKLN